MLDLIVEHNESKEVYEKYFKGIFVDSTGIVVYN